MKTPRAGKLNQPPARSIMSSESQGTFFQDCRAIPHHEVSVAMQSVPQPDTPEARATVIPIRLLHLRSRLFPARTRLRDVPPDCRGLTWSEWEELQMLEAKCQRP